MAEKQKELEKKFKKSKKISICLCNLAKLLAESGPIKKIQRLNEIESRRVLEDDEIKEKIFSPRKKSQRKKEMSPRSFSDMVPNIGGGNTNTTGNGSNTNKQSNHTHTQNQTVPNTNNINIPINNPN